MRTGSLEAEKLRMPLVKLKHKGQMTIPAEIRDRLQLQQGDLLEASTDGRSVILTPKALVDRETLTGGDKPEVHR